MDRIAGCSTDAQLSAIAHPMAQPGTAATRGRKTLVANAAELRYCNLMSGISREVGAMSACRGAADRGGALGIP